METFAERLQHAMDDAGLTQAELSRRANISRASVSLYLSGQTKMPTNSVMYRIARALSVDKDWLSGVTPKNKKQVVTIPEGADINRLFEMLLEDQQVHIVSEMNDLVQENKRQLEELQKKFK